TLDAFGKITVPSSWHELWIITPLKPERALHRSRLERLGRRGMRNMDTQTLIIVAATVAVCALIGTAVWFAVEKARSRRLREHFGPEYDRVVQQTHNRNVAEAELENREKRVRTYRIVPLSTQDRANYREAWAAVQNRFVDDPQDAVKEGHGLIFEVMDKRGYPVTNFEQA